MTFHTFAIYCSSSGGDFKENYPGFVVNITYKAQVEFISAQRSGGVELAKMGELAEWFFGNAWGSGARPASSVGLIFDGESASGHRGRWSMVMCGRVNERLEPAGAADQAAAAPISFLRPDSSC
jgi:hypothetical protein